MKNTINNKVICSSDVEQLLSQFKHKDINKFLYVPRNQKIKKMEDYSAIFLEES